MRLVLSMLGIALAAAAFNGSAQAQSYPWCALYAGGTDDSQNCGFVSEAQCKATISGIGGFCMPNTLYQPSGTSPRASRRPREAAPG